MNGFVLLTILNDAGTPIIGLTLRGWVMDALNPGAAPPQYWTQATDGQGQVTVNLGTQYPTGTAVWVAASTGTLDGGTAWEAHFAQHRVQRN